MNCLKALIPNPTKNEFYGVKEHLEGQMCVFSFHVMSAEEIRCYMFYGGQCLRFYANDIFNILPELFADTEGVRAALIEKLEDQKDTTWKKRFDTFGKTLEDKVFEQFYHGLVGAS